MSSNEVKVSDDGTNKGSAIGTITSASGAAYNATRIQLFRQTVKQPIELVEGKPNDKGGYSLSYPLDTGQPMDLWVGIPDDHGGFVARSEVCYRAPRTVRIDLVVPPGRKADPVSEWQRLQASVSPRLEGVPLAQLTPDQLNYLSRSTQVPLDCLSAAVAAARAVTAPELAEVPWMASSVAKQRCGA